MLPTVSASAWRGLSLVWFLFLAVLLAAEATAGWFVFVQDQRGTLGWHLEGEVAGSRLGSGTHAPRVLRLDGDSPLRGVGVETGDRLRYVDPMQHGRLLRPGETVALQRSIAEGWQDLEITAVARPTSFLDRWTYGSVLAFGAACLMLATLVAWREPISASHRLLAVILFLLVSPVFYMPGYMEPGTFLETARWFAAIAHPLTWLLPCEFVMRYQPHKPQRLVPWLKYLRRLAWLGCLAVLAQQLWFVLGNETPWLGVTTLAMQAVVIVLAALATWGGWRCSKGEMRQRHLWLFTSMVAIGLPPMLLFGLRVDWEPTPGVSGAGVIMTLCGIVGVCVLVYAVLGLHVVNFQFALNRLIVFSTLSFMLLLAVHGVEKGIDHVVAQSGLLQDDWSMSFAALLVYVTFHKLHNRIEHRVGLLFFKKWHENEQELRRFVRDAAFITNEPVLLKRTQDAFVRFSQGASCTLYLSSNGASYRAEGKSAADGMPREFDPNDPLVVRMKRQSEGAVLREQLDTAVPWALALPMVNSGKLAGFVVMGYKPKSRDSYRPDELNVLAFAAEQTGLLLHALRVEALQNRLAELEQHRGSSHLMAASARTEGPGAASDAAT